MIDEIDQAILQELKADSRLSFAEIERKVKLSPSAVRDKVIKMEDIGLTKKYSIELNQKFLGNDLAIFIWVKVLRGKLNAFLKIIPPISEIQKAYRIIGHQNIHLKVLLRNQVHLQNVIEQIMSYGDTQTMLILSDILDRSE